MSAEWWIVGFGLLVLAALGAVACVVLAAFFPYVAWLFILFGAGFGGLVGWIGMTLWQERRLQRRVAAAREQMRELEGSR